MYLQGMYLECLGQNGYTDNMDVSQAKGDPQVMDDLLLKMIWKGWKLGAPPFQETKILQIGT